MTIRKVISWVFLSVLILTITFSCLVYMHLMRYKTWENAVRKNASANIFRLKTESVELLKMLDLSDKYGIVLRGDKVPSAFQQLSCGVKEQGELLILLSKNHPDVVLVQSNCF